MPRAPIELDLYDSNNEIVKSLSRIIVPWGLLKKAVRLSSKLGQAADQIETETLDELADLVVQIFGEEKVSRSDLDNYADIGDMITVIQTIVQRGHGLIPNAPPAAS